jgi:hypothetical protein
VQKTEILKILNPENNAGIHVMAIEAETGKKPDKKTDKNDPE